ncbi:hypothetical protein HQ945_05260 [Phyllobacterium sp. BT25]|uniref:Uncharacterized protein n=1 Tax=Phyllobacterium pellucidum TaxID=2740464 RepID=A0A849VMP2_9HYPH|nr:hypothetical protein [Phyllobacterium pellucidum]NTS30656.1 hypothetical protein [Phyllobacterium pellucidum]
MFLGAQQGIDRCLDFHQILKRPRVSAVLSYLDYLESPGTDEFAYRLIDLFDVLRCHDAQCAFRRCEKAPPDRLSIFDSFVQSREGLGSIAWAAKSSSGDAKLSFLVSLVLPRKRVTTFCKRFMMLS